MRRPSTLLLALLLLPLVPLPSSGAGTASSPWTSYDVRLAPLPNPSAGCHSGVEGVHLDTRPVVAPRTGRIEVVMPGLAGDFDILLTDDKGRSVGGGGFGDQTFGPGSSEQAVARVRRGERLTLSVCNYSSAVPTATVRYRFVDPAATPTPAAGFRALAPGQLPDLRERVPVNVVTVGYGRELDTTKLVAGLPKVNRPHERIAAFYGYERPLGITYTYDYRVTRASASYADRLFGELTRLGEPVALSPEMKAYNASAKASRQVTRPIAIDAPTVERWLAEHPPPGVDTSKHTVFLLNWWGGKGFRFHVYRHTTELVNDTHKAYGKDPFEWVNAWGGSAPDDPETGTGAVRRVWFHDLSAGPDYWNGSGEVDDSDVDDDGVKERVLLPSWEPRTSRVLTKDLSDLVRYVAVNLLFTPSPLYSVRPRTPQVDSSFDIDLNVYELDPQTAGRIPLQPSVLRRSVAGISPQLRVTSDLQVPSTDPVHAACFAEWVAAQQAPAYLPGPGCLPQYRYSSYDNPFTYATSRLPSFLDDQGKVDREIPVFSYHVPDDVSGCFAYADDNHLDGTPSMVFGFFPTSCRAAIGTTDIMTHEVGHELGLAHPHDGYDYERDTDYGAYGDTFFVGAGDAVSSVMSYLFVNNEYSQFDRDNYARFATAAYLYEVNALAGKVLASGKPARAELRQADAAMALAVDRFAGHAYSSAAQAARSAYLSARAAATRSGVPLTASTLGTDPVSRLQVGSLKGRGYSRAHVIDPSTGLPTRCRSGACQPGVPAYVTNLGGPLQH